MDVNVSRPRADLHSPHQQQIAPHGRPTHPAFAMGLSRISSSCLSTLTEGDRGEEHGLQM